MNILEKIIDNKKQEVKRQKEAFDINLMEEFDLMNRKTISMKKAICDSQCGIIAEFKRKSPSKGWIHPHAETDCIVPQYEKNGAAAVSILTDELYFGGRPSDICKVRNLTTLPILRKEFIIDPYQIFQAKAIGADAILLIAAALDIDKCHEFITKAHELDLEVLLELHDESELEYARLDADMIGINNRNLSTFVTDIAQSMRLIEKLPTNKCLISESGISNPETVIELRKKGFSGFLMGENFIKNSSPGDALNQFLNQYHSLKNEDKSVRYA